MTPISSAIKVFKTRFKKTKIAPPTATQAVLGVQHVRRVDGLFHTGNLYAGGTTWYPGAFSAITGTIQTSGTWGFIGTPQNSFVDENLRQFASELDLLENDFINQEIADLNADLERQV